MIIGTPYELAVSSADVRDFYKEHWNRNIPLSDERFYNWQFLESPGNNNRDNCCIALDESGSIVGVMGLNERPFMFLNETLNGAELTTWIVRQDEQNRGIGPHMLQYLQSKYQLLLGLGITTAALSLYLRHEFRYFNPISRYMRVLNWDRVGPFARFDVLARKIDRYWKRQLLEVPYRVCEPVPELVNFIGNNFAKSANMFNRNNEFLTWRYREHPVYNYHIVVVKGSEEPDTGAVVVFRIQDPTPDLRIAHIVDLYGDQSSMKAALTYLDMEMRSRKVDFIDFYSTWGPHQGIFMSSDWFSLENDSYFNFPHLFNPIELRSPASTSMVLWKKDDKLDIYNNSLAYISKQDADFDRP